MSKGKGSKSHQLIALVLAVASILSGCIAPLSVAYAAVGQDNCLPGTSPTAPAPISNAARSTPDSSTGVQGAAQTYSVLGNDTPASGATFVLGSLTLALVANPVAGSTLSGDHKTVTAPTEGVYVANSNGTITFTPDPAFVGTTKGVMYTIQDTAGNTTTSSYTPTVTGVVACSDPASETAVLDPLSITFNTLSYDFFTNISASYNATYASEVYGSPMMNSDGSKIIVFGGSGSMYTSVDHGATWTRQALGFPIDQHMATASSDLSKIVINPGNGSAYIKVSTDGGVSWQDIPTPNGYATDLSTKLTISGDGSTIGIGTGDYWVTRDTGTSWQKVYGVMDNGYPSTYLKNAAISYDGKRIIAGNISGNTTPYIMTFDEVGGVWQMTVNNPSPEASGAYYNISMSADGSKVIAQFQGNNPYISVSTTGGQTWGTALDVFAAFAISSPRVQYSPDGSTVFMTAYGKTLKSTDDGQNWTIVQQGQFVNDNTTGIVTSSNSSIITTTGAHGHVYTSTNGGTSWLDAVPEPITITAATPIAIDVDPATPGTQYSQVNAAQGWRVVFDPVTYVYTVTIINGSAFVAAFDAGNVHLTYTLAAKAGCSQPPAADVQLKRFFQPF